jgi:hypothetical protein
VLLALTERLWPRPPARVRLEGAEGVPVLIEVESVGGDGESADSAFRRLPAAAAPRRPCAARSAATTARPLLTAAVGTVAAVGTGRGHPAAPASAGRTEPAAACAAGRARPAHHAAEHAPEAVGLGPELGLPVPAGLERDGRPAAGLGLGERLERPPRRARRR